MLSGKDDSGESRMREICMSGSTREGEAAVIGLRASHPVLSPLLYRFGPVLQSRGLRQKDSALLTPLCRHSTYVLCRPSAYEHPYAHREVYLLPDLRQAGWNAL